MHLGRTRGECGAGTHLKMAVVQHLHWVTGQFPRASLLTLWLCCPLIPRLIQGPRAQENRRSRPGPGLCVTDLGPRINSSHAHFLWAPTVMGHRPPGGQPPPAVLYFWVGSGGFGLKQPWLRTIPLSSVCRPGVYCADFPAISNTPLRVIQVFLPLDFPWANFQPSPFLLALKPAGSQDSCFPIHLRKTSVCKEDKDLHLAPARASHRAVSPKAWPL